MRKNILRLLHILSYLCMFTALTACSTSPWTLFDTKISAKILASFDINPDVNGRPSPMVIRIYELKTNNTFDSVDFFKFYDDEEATLGEDLLSRQEFELSPGVGREIIFNPHSQTRYFGVIAAYRNIDQARWRASKVLELNKNNSFIVRVGK